MDNDFEKDELSEFEEPTTMQKVKEWVQENLRIIVSILIVFLIASSIYSYSKRGEESTEVAQENSELENILSDLPENKQEEIKAEEPKQNVENKAEETKKEEPKKEEVKKEAVQNTSESQETEKSFIESAQRGDGTTHLARRALAHYLEKNPDSSLTNEHKIYIEDYLRKNVSTKGYIGIGTSVEFSKDLIKQAIGASKNLNENQLKNLEKYSARVSF